MPPPELRASRKGLNYKGREGAELPSPPPPVTKGNSQFTLIIPLSAAEEVSQSGSLQAARSQLGSTERAGAEGGQRRGWTRTAHRGADFPRDPRTPFLSRSYFSVL